MSSEIKRIENDFHASILTLEDDTGFIVWFYNNNGIFIKDKTFKCKLEKLYFKIYEYLDNGSTFKNLSSLLSKFNAGNIYSASYGIGIDTLFNSEKKENAEKIIELLTTNNIIFNTEYSDAYWVYRIKISKTKENLEKLSKLLVKKD